MEVTTASSSDGHNGNCLVDYISQLPQDCLSNVIALTSVRDACRSSAVSTAFLAASESDSVWEHFLPADLPSILDRAELDAPMMALTKKELYFDLCNHEVFLDGGVKSFKLDMASGAKIYFLSARALSIIWGDTPQYWQWIDHQDSRFSEVAELLHVCWFEVGGTFECKELSRKTNYAAYFVFKTTNNSGGLDDPIYKAILSVGNHESERQTVCLKRRTRERHRDENVRFPQARADGWMEIKLGEFYIDDGEEGVVVMKLLETENLWWKNGLIVEGIEIRPEMGN